MKIKIEGFIRAYHWAQPERPLENFYFSMLAEPATEYDILLTPHTIETEVELPKGEALTAKMIEGLRAAAAHIYAEAAQKAAPLEKRIQQLLAITNETGVRNG